MPVPSRPGPVRRIAPALRQNCIRSWPNHQLRTEAKAKNPSLERTRPTPSPPLPKVSRPTSVARSTQSLARLASDPDPQPSPAAGRPAPAGPTEATEDTRAAPGVSAGHRANCAAGKRISFKRQEQAAKAQTRKPPAARTDIGQGGSDFFTGDEGFSAGGRGDPRGRPPCGDLGEVPIAGTWGEVPVGETAMGEWPWVGEAWPPAQGRRGTRGMGGGGGPPWPGEVGISPARYGGTGREAGAA
jgi:hypothetical protein